MPNAYPYIRFSSDRQKDGLSIQRQTEAIEAYLSENPHLTVDKSLNLEDLGKSGYSGRHLQKGGALYLFLEKIKSGEIKKGSVLIIEHFNRLSRLKLNKAMDLFNEILRHGIDIAVLDEKQVFTAESISSIDYIKAVLKFDLAHEESKDKSKKGKDNWRFKKEALRNAENPQIERLKFTKTLPLWLEKTDQQIVINEEKSETIKLIFRLCIENNGYMRIARHLNTNKIKRLDGSDSSWTFDIIKRLLFNRALLGEYQPRKTVEIEGRARPEYVPNDEDPIKGAYPPVIDEDTFNAAHNGLTSRKNKGGGRRADMPNLFVKLLKCDECGGSIKYQKSHNGYKQYSYLKCFNNIYSHCINVKTRSLRYDAFEEMFFKLAGKLNLEEIFQKNDQSKEVKKEITKLTAHKNKTQEKLNEILEQIEKMEFSKSLYSLVLKLENQINECDKSIKQKYQELSTVKQDEIDSRIKEFKEINNLLLQSKEIEIREKINNHLRALIESIAINFDLNYFIITFKNGIKRIIREDRTVINIENEPNDLPYIPPHPDSVIFTAEIVNDHKKLLEYLKELSEE